MTTPLHDSLIPLIPIYRHAPSAAATFGLCANLDLPSGRGFIAMLEAFRATGGTASGEVTSRLFASHQVGNTDSLADLICKDQVFGFEWRSKLWIPMFQFDLEDLSLKLEAQHVRSALPSLWHGWVIAAWFATPNACLDGGLPVDLLESDFDAVMLAAWSAHASEDFLLANVQQANPQYSLNF